MIDPPPPNLAVGRQQGMVVHPGHPSVLVTQGILNDQLEAERTALLSRQVTRPPLDDAAERRLIAERLNYIAEQQQEALALQRYQAEEQRAEAETAAARDAAAVAAAAKQATMSSRIFGLAESTLGMVQENLSLTRNINRIVEQFERRGLGGIVVDALRSEMLMVTVAFAARPWMPHYTDGFMANWVIANLLDRTFFRRESPIKIPTSIGGALYEFTLSPLAIMFCVWNVLNLYEKLEIENPAEFNRLFPGTVEVAASYLMSAAITRLPSFLYKPPTDAPAPAPAAGIPPGEWAQRERLPPSPPGQPASWQVPTPTAVPTGPPAARVWVRAQFGDRSVAIGPNIEEHQLVIDMIENGLSIDQVKDKLAEFHRGKLTADFVERIRKIASDAVEASIETLPEVWNAIIKYLGAAYKKRLMLTAVNVIVISLMAQMSFAMENGIEIGEPYWQQLTDHLQNSTVGYILPTLGFILKVAMKALLGSWSPMGGQDKQMQLQITKLEEVKKDTIRDSVILSLQTVLYHRALHEFAEKFSGGKYKMDANLKASTDNTIISGILLDNAYSSKPVYTLEFLNKFKSGDISEEILGGSRKSRRSYKNRKTTSRRSYKKQVRHRQLHE